MAICMLFFLIIPIVFAIFICNYITVVSPR